MVPDSVTSSVTSQNLAYKMTPRIGGGGCFTSRIEVYLDIKLSVPSDRVYEALGQTKKNKLLVPKCTSQLCDAGCRTLDSNLSFASCYLLVSANRRHQRGTRKQESG